ncbi:cytochrome b-245 light chain-like [Pomacea canaliculata]|uniref:cytochrome b-245 light chain-like n=1 Tax=Pomacea canaliculata TaxID=400727 RepID=UPI000D739E8A|nr:cytochrome b-245 light chain-like [Pomacea canaliculata]XP_025114895.1 cytochrome b-245 light chain-like [Pomacea canaliculata]
MGKIEWAMWANEQALVSSVVVFLGGVLAVAGQFKYWQFGAYAIAASAFVAILEYPRGKRQTGRTVQRKFQYCFTVVVRTGGLITRNYFVRFILHLLLSVACCFHLSTLLGGICFMITSAIYLMAAFKGEEWTPVEKEKDPEEDNEPNIIPQPRKPPPRRPLQTEADNQL